MDRRNPHNAYYYKPLDQAAPIYVQPSQSTRHILPVPQKPGQSEYDYGMPGQASPVYIPASGERKEMDKYDQTRRAVHDNTVAMSDRHSKEQIQRLSSQNDALTAALDQAHAAHGGEGVLPPTEYPRLPSHTQFADSPVAQQVAAQNAQMAPPPQPFAPTPQAPAPSGFQRPQLAPPNLSELDDAYRRMGGAPQS